MKRFNAVITYLLITDVETTIVIDVTAMDYNSAILMAASKAFAFFTGTNRRIKNIELIEVTST